MELTDSFLTLLQNFAPVFTAPTYQTFVVIVTGWIISQRHRYVTEVIFSSGRVGDGHGLAVSSLLQPRRLWGKSGVLQPIMPLDSPVKVRPWELTVYPRSHIRR